MSNECSSSGPAGAGVMAAGGEEQDVEDDEVYGGVARSAHTVAGVAGSAQPAYLL